MRIVLSGGTGFVGRSLVTELLRRDHEVVVLTRSPSRARTQMESSVVIVDIEDELAVQLAVDGAGAVVNLAGESVVQGRWTQSVKKRIWDSRVDLTKTLVESIGRARHRPPVLVSASAIGFYGDTGDEVVDESSKPSTGFLSEVCCAWEAEACEAKKYGVRVVRLRLGTVLGSNGGVIRRLLPLFRHRLGGTLGGGEQWMSWIHEDDLVEVILASVFRENWQGPINAVAPTPVRNKEFTAELSRVLGKPTLLPVPAPVLRLVFGDGADVLLEGTRVEPRHLLEESFTFAYPTVKSALVDILEKASGQRVSGVPQEQLFVGRR